MIQFVKILETSFNHLHLHFKCTDINVHLGHVTRATHIHKFTQSFDILKQDAPQKYNQSAFHIFHFTNLR